MRKLMLILLAAAVICGAVLFGQEGQASLNVTGTWQAKEWGKIVLNQKSDSTDITGKGDGWDITGHVSGNKVTLMFSHKAVLGYMAELTSEDSNTLVGRYANGMLTASSKTRAIRMTK
jgi:hypothetical protein